MHTYDIYDGEKQIRTMVTAREIARDYNLDPHQIHAMAKRSELLDGKYRLEVGKEVKYDERVEMISLWEKRVKPFRNVIWCKELGPGVKQLKIRPKTEKERKTVRK